MNLWFLLLISLSDLRTYKLLLLPGLHTQLVELFLLLQRYGGRFDLEHISSEGLTSVPEQIISVFFGAIVLPGENHSKLVRIYSEDRQGRQEKISLMHVYEIPLQCRNTVVPYNVAEVLPMRPHNTIAACSQPSSEAIQCQQYNNNNNNNP